MATASRAADCQRSQEQKSTNRAVATPTLMLADKLRRPLGGRAGPNEHMRPRQHGGVAAVTHHHRLHFVARCMIHRGPVRHRNKLARRPVGKCLCSGLGALLGSRQVRFRYRPDRLRDSERLSAAVYNFGRHAVWIGKLPDIEPLLSWHRQSRLLAS